MHALVRDNGDLGATTTLVGAVHSDALHSAVTALSSSCVHSLACPMRRRCKQEQCCVAAATMCKRRSTVS